MSIITITRETGIAGLDQYAVNNMICALQLEMGSSPSEPGRDHDALFMGGSDVNAADEDALGSFAVDKNWHILLASFDPADPTAGPVDFRAVITDGLTKSVIMAGGRLWKKDRRSNTVILFPKARSVLKLTTKGRLVVGPISGRRHDHGYELARMSLASHAAKCPGGVPLVAPVGGLLTIMDARTLTMMFKAA